MDTRPGSSRAGSLPLVGGVLALDFCNTASGRGTEDHLEHLNSAGDVITWARHTGVLDETREGVVRRRCEADPRLGARLLDRARRLRDAIYTVDADLAQHRGANQSGVDVVARSHAACLAKGRLGLHEGSFGWTWDAETSPEEAILGPISASAMAIFTTADKARLKQCEGHHCGWLFLDTTKSNNRRWCEMEVCGNRAKQRRRRGRQSASG